MCTCVLKKYSKLKYFHQGTVARFCQGSRLFALPCQNNGASCFPFLCPRSSPKVLLVKHVVGSCSCWLKICCSYTVHKSCGGDEVKHPSDVKLLISCTCLEERPWREDQFLCGILILLPVSVIQKSWGVWMMSLQVVNIVSESLFPVS